jgi:hypothetical protein
MNPEGSKTKDNCDGNSQYQFTGLDWSELD